MNEAVIQADGVTKIYGAGHNSLVVLDDVSLTINKGEVVSIMGPSGAGKSTLLNLIGCLDTFQKGELKLLGRDVSDFSVDDLSGFRNRHIGFIFQLHNLLPEFTALENVMIPLLIGRENRSTAKKKALDLISRFRLGDRINHKPGELSGGECQRIAVARAIVGMPDLILADEPTGSLDSANTAILTDILFDFGREFNTTIVIVTHDNEVAAMTERTISLLDGRIEGEKQNQ